MKARATPGVNTPKSGNANHSFNGNGNTPDGEHTKIVTLPSLRFRVIGRTTDKKHPSIDRSKTET